MNEVVVSGIGILLFDAVLWSALWAGLVLLRCSSCGGLEGLWAFSAVRWAILRYFTFRLTDGKPQAVLLRLGVLLCLLSPVFESGRMLMAAPLEPHSGPFPGLNMLLQGMVSSVLACTVWELGLSADRNVKRPSKKVNARQLLFRMLEYFKPDTLYIIAAFTFLVMGVICKSELILFHFKHLKFRLIVLKH